MPYIFQSKNKNGQPHPRWKFQYTDWRGRRRTGTGVKSKTETRKLAERLQAKHDAIRRGHEPPPRSWNKHAKRHFAEVKDEYLAWGESQGGRGGRPWSKTHARKQRSHLTWWQEQLGLETLNDIDGILSRVERALRELQDGGDIRLAGKTIEAYAASLKTFCRWCVKRGYVPDDPLKDLVPFDTTPESTRRAMTLDEIHRLLKVAPEHRRLVYEVALASGLRVGELRALSLDDLDTKSRGLWLSGEWTKNRRDGFQRLSSKVLGRLQAFVESGAAVDLYRKAYGGRKKKTSVPDKPLLYVPTHMARELDKDLQVAKIPKITPLGRLDFHSFRTTFVTLILDSGASAKEAQVAARHATVDLTFNTYGRARIDRLAELAEAVGDAILPDNAPSESTISAQPQMLKKAAGAENAYLPTLYDPGRLVEAGGIEPPSRDVSTKASTHIVYLLVFRLARLR